MEHVGPDRLGELGTELHELYRQCFAEPPWNESPWDFDGYPTRLAKQLATPGFHGVVAMDESGLAGVIYGWPAGETFPDGPFYQALAAGLPKTVHHLLRNPAVEVVELMVQRRSRGRGLGRALLDRFVSSYPTAWLCTHPEAPAARLYERAGWVARGEFSYHDSRRVVYTWAAFPPSTGSTARTAVPEPSLR